MQVQLGQQGAHFFRASLEQRQERALEALIQAAHPRPLNRDRAVQHAQPALLPNPFRYTAGSPADLRSDFALPRNSVSSSSSSTWITFRTCARAFASSVSHTGLDAASLLRIFLHMAVAPFVSGTRPGVLVAPERCHRLQLISTPFEVSSRRCAKISTLRSIFAWIRRRPGTPMLIALHSDDITGCCGASLCRPASPLAWLTPRRATICIIVPHWESSRSPAMRSFPRSSGRRTSRH